MQRDLSFIPLFLLFFAVIFVCALPGFIVTVLIARYFGFRRWLFFIIAGGLDGVLAGVLALKILYFPNPHGIIILTVFVGGLAGGLTYWLIAYPRRAA